MVMRHHYGLISFTVNDPSADAWQTQSAQEFGEWLASFAKKDGVVMRDNVFLFERLASENGMELLFAFVSDGFDPWINSYGATCTLERLWESQQESKETKSLAQSVRVSAYTEEEFMAAVSALFQSAGATARAGIVERLAGFRGLASNPPPFDVEHYRSIKYMTGGHPVLPGDALSPATNKALDIILADKPPKEGW